MKEHREQRKVNRDHADPTAEIAIANVTREERKKKDRQRTYDDGRGKGIRKMVRGQ